MSPSDDEAVSIVRALEDSEPLVLIGMPWLFGVLGDYVWRCGACYSSSTGKHTDHVHREDCPWLRAVRYVEAMRTGEGDK